MHYFGIFYSYCERRSSQDIPCPSLWDLLPGREGGGGGLCLLILALLKAEVPGFIFVGALVITVTRLSPAGDDGYRNDASSSVPLSECLQHSPGISDVGHLILLVGYIDKLTDWQTSASKKRTLNDQQRKLNKTFAFSDWRGWPPKGAKGCLRLSFSEAAVPVSVERPHTILHGDIEVWPIGDTVIGVIDPVAINARADPLMSPCLEQSAKVVA